MAIESCSGFDVNCTLNPSAGNQGYGVHVHPTVNPQPNGDGGGMYVQPTVNEASSGTHQILTGVYIAAPTITAGSASVTDAISLYIAGQPNASGATNLSLYVGSGNSRIKDRLAVGPITTPSHVLDVAESGSSNYAARFRNLTASTPYTVLIEEPESAASGYPLLIATSNGGSTTRFRVNSGTGDTEIGGKLTVDGKPDVRFRSNTINMADNSTAALGPSNSFDGFVFVTNRAQGRSAIFEIQGGNNSTAEIADAGGIFSPTAGTANSINVYWSAGNSRYEIENKRGTTVTVNIFVFETPA